MSCFIGCPSAHQALSWLSIYRPLTKREFLLTTIISIPMNLQFWTKIGYFLRLVNRNLEMLQWKRRNKRERFSFLLSPVSISDRCHNQTWWRDCLPDIASILVGDINIEMTDGTSLMDIPPWWSRTSLDPAQIVDEDCGITHQTDENATVHWFGLR